MQATLLSIISQKTYYVLKYHDRKKTSKLPVILLHNFKWPNYKVVSSKQNMVIRKPSELTLHLLLMKLKLWSMYLSTIFKKTENHH